MLSTHRRITIHQPYGYTVGSILLTLLMAVMAVLAWSAGAAPVGLCCAAGTALGFVVVLDALAEPSQR